MSGLTASVTKSPFGCHAKPEMAVKPSPTLIG